MTNHTGSKIQAQRLFGTTKRLEFGLLVPKRILVVKLLIFFPLRMWVVHRKPQPGITSMAKNLLHLMILWLILLLKQFVIATLMSVTNLMEVVFAQMDTMESNANLSVSAKTA